MSQFTPMFSVGETLVALDETCPFEAKILKIKEHEGVQKYVVHFVGWKSRYDFKVAVGEEQGILFKGTMKEYVKEHRSKIENERFLEKFDKESETMKEPAAKKKKMEKTPEAPQKVKRDYQQFSSLKWELELPKKLRKVLVDDYDFVGKGLLWTIPSKVPIDEIVKNYEKSLPHSNPPKFPLAARGMVDYLNQVMKYKLLYASEREQFNKLSDILPSSVYGLPHLLRLFAKAPEIILFSKNEEKMLPEFVQDMQKFVDFVGKTYNEYYKGRGDYSVPKN